jgi:hypothetical protein
MFRIRSRSIATRLQGRRVHDRTGNRPWGRSQYLTSAEELSSSAVQLTWDTVNSRSIRRIAAFLQRKIGREQYAPGRAECDLSLIADAAHVVCIAVLVDRGRYPLLPACSTSRLTAASAWVVFDLPFAVKILNAHATGLIVAENAQGRLMCASHDRKLTSKVRTNKLNVYGGFDDGDAGVPSRCRPRRRLERMAKYQANKLAMSLVCRVAKDDTRGRAVSV